MEPYQELGDKGNAMVSFFLVSPNIRPSALLEDKLKLHYMQTRNPMNLARGTRQ